MRELKSAREIVEAPEDILIIDVNAVAETFSEVLSAIKEARTKGSRKSIVLRSLGLNKLENLSHTDAELALLRAGGDMFVCADDAEQLRALESGRIHILKASMERVSRQKHPEATHGAPKYKWGNFLMWPERRVFTINGVEVYLPKAQWNIMEKFLEKKQDILQYEFLESVSPNRLALATSIKRMNKKLRLHGYEMVSEHGIGYKIVPLETQ